MVSYTRDKYPSEVAGSSQPHKVIDSRRFDDSKTRHHTEAKINVTNDIDDNKVILVFPTSFCDVILCCLLT